MHIEIFYFYFKSVIACRTIDGNVTLGGRVTIRLTR